MVIFDTEKRSDEYRMSFNSYKELKQHIARYGSFNFNGTRIRYLLYEDDIQVLRSMSNSDEDILVITSANNIKTLQNLVEDTHFNPSKYDIIIDILNKENIDYANDKVIRLIMKSIPTKYLSKELKRLAEENNFLLTEEVIHGNYFISNVTHPIDVLMAVLKNRGYKAILSKCRRTYSDKSIKSVILDYLRNALYIIEMQYAGKPIKNNKVSVFGLDKCSDLFYFISSDSILERSLVNYGRKYSRVRRGAI